MDILRPSGQRQFLGHAQFATPAVLLAVLVLPIAVYMPCLPAAEQSSLSANLEIRKGDHISLIGNTLADRMQHDGWLETYLQGRFPRHELTIRNLGYSADGLTVRLRSADFGTPDEWLSRTKTNVVFAFFGYNESFGDLNRFRRALAAFITHTLGQKYNGTSAPWLVLFSPIAHENLHDRSLPDGTQNNARLERIISAMGEIARAHHVGFVNLFHPMQQLYAGATKPYTINGIHLTSEGNRLLAVIIDHTLLPEGPMFKRDAQAFEKAPTDRAREESLLVQPPSHGGWLLDLRRPGRSALRRRPDQSRGDAV